MQQVNPSSLTAIRALRRSYLLTFLVAAGGFLLAPASNAQPQAPASGQDALFQQMLRNPENLDVTLAYAKTATANGDYEAAIGALERVLFWQPTLSRVKYELGTLYFRLGSYEMARRYFREALESADLDSTTQKRIQTWLPDAEKQLQRSRLSGYAQTGFRYQSNANYAPVGGVVRLGGQDLALQSSATRQGDTNWFILGGLAHDYDLSDRHGDQLETRFAGYLTKQMRFSDLDVGLFDLTIGPRMALAPTALPGATIKPYAAGGYTWVGGTPYLGNAGAGLSANFPVSTRISLGPEIEWRHVFSSFSGGQTFTTFTSGDWFTAGVSASVALEETIRLDIRAFYRRGESELAFQTYNQWVGEAAVTFAFAPPFTSIPRNWSVAPYVRLIQTGFMTANPSIDPTTPADNTQWIGGLIFNAPIAKSFGLSATIQYDHIDSSLPNYRQDNISILIGPTVRF